jgi:hypothetical protein
MAIDPMNEMVVEIAADRHRLQSATEALADTKDLCERARLLVQESQELLRQVDDLRTGIGTVIRKNKYDCLRA